MHLLSNTHTDLKLAPSIPFPSTDAGAVQTLLAQCPAAKQTPLVAATDLAQIAQVAQVWVKDERARMALGSFKALGAAYVIATDAVATGATDLATALAGKTYITASAGNHGLSVAAGARVFGANAIIYIAQTVPESFAHRLRDKGAQVVRAGVDYEASMAAAKTAAASGAGQLLSDSSWEGYTQAPHRLMEGYLAMIDEAATQIPTPPTHIFLQAGVGGLAGAVAALARVLWGAEPTIVVVEPEAAPALFESIKAGRFVATTGPISAMGRLDCKEASLIALKGLARDADVFVTLSEQEAADAMPVLSTCNLATTPSGGAGLAALLAASDADRAALGLSGTSRVLTFLSEAPDA
jgi:diaminopropionate ammonia-lyase